MNEVTAVTISHQPCDRVIPGVEHLNFDGQVIQSAAGACHSWRRSIDSVSTPWFFWLDSDDDLPEDYLSVLAECIAAAGELDLAYTDELIVDGESETLRASQPYSQELHLSRPTLLHHMVLVRTAAAREAFAGLPRGHYWPEMLLYWHLARRGAPYVPRVGYRWNQSTQGLSRQWFTTYGMAQSQLWCKAHP